MVRNPKNMVMLQNVKELCGELEMKQCTKCVYWEQLIKMNLYGCVTWILGFWKS